MKHFAEKTGFLDYSDRKYTKKRNLFVHRGEGYRITVTLEPNSRYSRVYTCDTSKVRPTPVWHSPPDAIPGK
ncbi:MAG: hypothetical protein A4E63_03298 [Syntrophorhabdus sp. PtaU1.Bin050]|nr:MAG: hypothetical protein A4E63_03298 [Syntrophorhabdus sp. PtaU1.Bin050]